MCSLTLLSFFLRYEHLESTFGYHSPRCPGKITIEVSSCELFMLAVVKSGMGRLILATMS